MSVLVCRGCCCGSASTHPTVDHAGQLERLRGALPDEGTRLWTVDCLGPCARANVVVVRSGGVRRWFGDVLDDADTDALAAWIHDDAPHGTPPPPRLAAREFQPDEAAVMLRADERNGDALAALLSATVAAPPSGGGAWLIGVEGAAAELPLEPCTEDGSGLAGPVGGLRVALAAASLELRPRSTTQAFVARDADGFIRVLVLAEPRDHLPAAAPVLTELGPDTDALDPAGRRGTLFDLGLGRPAVSFGVRTAETELIAQLRGACGLGWRQALDQVGPALLAASPTRVVRTAIARAEVSSPIPPPDGASPEGAHTHLLPPLLELGRELPVGLTLPPGLAPVATYLPGPATELR